MRILRAGSMPYWFQRFCWSAMSIVGLCRYWFKGFLKAPVGPRRILHSHLNLPYGELCWFRMCSHKDQLAQPLPSRAADEALGAFVCEAVFCAFSPWSSIWLCRVAAGLLSGPFGSRCGYRMNGQLLLLQYSGTSLVRPDSPFWLLLTVPAHVSPGHQQHRHSTLASLSISAPSPHPPANTGSSSPFWHPAPSFGPDSDAVTTFQGICLLNKLLPLGFSPMAFYLPKLITLYFMACQTCMCLSYVFLGSLRSGIFCFCF